MEIGKLDTRITVNVYTKTQNATGEPTVQSTATGDVWARVEPITGTEIQQAGGRTATADVLFTLRYYSTLTETSTITHSGDLYEILSIKTLERDSFHQVMARKYD